MYVFAYIGKVGSLRSSRLEIFKHTKQMGSLDNVFEKENLMKFILKCNTTINPIEEERTEIIDVRTDILRIGEEDILLNTNANQVVESDMNNENKKENKNEISIKKIKINKDRKEVSNSIETNAIKEIQNIDAKIILSGHTKNVPQNVPENVTFVVEPKIDGLSLSVRYSGNGTFLGAGTRGDGVEGEDVSANIEVRY